MANQAFLIFSNVTMVLNRVLAWLDYLVHNTTGYLFYYLLGGMKPQYHTRPAKLHGGATYSPSVVITGASQGSSTRERAVTSSITCFSDPSLHCLLCKVSSYM